MGSPMTRTGRLIVTLGLSAYGLATALSLAVFLAAREDAFRGVFLVAVSLPWSLLIFAALDMFGLRPFDGPGGDVWAVGIGLAGVSLNACLFWLVVRLIDGIAVRRG